MYRVFASFAMLMTLGLAACGTDWSAGPDDGGASFSRRFHYYYEVDCRYDAFDQPYDCSDTYTMSPSMSVDLRITHDGYASLCVDDECSYYDPGEYDPNSSISIPIRDMQAIIITITMTHIDFSGEIFYL